MTCHFSPYPALQEIDITPLEATLRSLCVMLCTMDVLIHGGREALRISLQLKRSAAQLLKADTHNRRVRMKLRMLASPTWRARVLKDLGGERALKRWERHRGWIKPSPKDPLRPHASPAQRRARTANLAKAKAALRDRYLKRGPRHKPGDETHPNIVFDRVKMDREGQFRLAPITRGPRKGKPRDIQAKPAISAPTEKPRYKIRYVKADPIPIWPFEFRAAESMRDNLSFYEIKSIPRADVMEATAPKIVIPHEAACSVDAGPNRECDFQMSGPGSAGSALVRDDKWGTGTSPCNYIPPIFDG